MVIASGTEVWIIDSPTFGIYTERSPIPDFKAALHDMIQAPILPLLPEIIRPCPKVPLWEIKLLLIILFFISFFSIKDAEGNSLSITSLSKPISVIRTSPIKFMYSGKKKDNFGVWNVNM